jgi:hypothetical protein
MLLDRSRRRTLAVVLLSVVAPACSHKQSAEIGKPDDPAVIEASKSVEQFHALVNDGRYREVCQIAEPGAFAAVTNLSCAEFLARLHEKLGAVKVIKPSPKPTLVERSSGTMVRVALNYYTWFVKGPAGEHFEWRIQGKKVSLTNYDVNADALAP